VKLPPVTILLSSYNGEKFVTEQVASIQHQTHPNWTLLVRDDGSRDRTLEIVQALSRADPRIVILTDARGNLGAAGSFGVLLEHVLRLDAPYVALADQDDLWCPAKIARELELMLRREQQAGPRKPLLVHSDLSVVGHDLTPVHRSFLKYQGLSHEAKFPLGRLLLQNFVTGSTVLLNRSLLESATPVPDVIMHDWWLALCAAALGEIVFLPEATVRYRQHGGNAVGSFGLKHSVGESLRDPIASWHRADALLDRAVAQARELLRRVEREEQRHPADAQALQVLRAFTGAFAEGNGLTRLRVLARYGIRPRTFLPFPIRFYAGVLLWSPKLQTPATPGSVGTPGRVQDSR